MSKITNQSTLTSNYTVGGIKQSIETKSNISTTENMTEAFTKVLSSAVTEAIAKEEIEQTLVLTNTGDITITEISIKNTISAGATFKAGSLTIDDVSQPTFDPVTGYELQKDIANGETVTVKYTIVIDDVPTVSEVTDTAEITYSVGEVDNLVENSNTVTIDIKNDVIKIVKTSSASAVIKGQTLTFQNVITNEGDVTNTELVFKDPIPAGTTFVDGSVKIDNVSQPTYNPETGFSLNDLEPNGQIVVTFDVTIN